MVEGGTAFKRERVPLNHEVFFLLLFFVPLVFRVVLFSVFFSSSLLHDRDAFCLFNTPSPSIYHDWGATAAATDTASFTYRGGGKGRSTTTANDKTTTTQSTIRINTGTECWEAGFFAFFFLRVCLVRSRPLRDFFISPLSVARSSLFFFFFLLQGGSAGLLMGHGAYSLALFLCCHVLGGGLGLSPSGASSRFFWEVVG